MKPGRKVGQTSTCVRCGLTGHNSTSCLQEGEPDEYDVLTNELLRDLSGVFRNGGRGAVAKLVASRLRARGYPG